MTTTLRRRSSLLLTAVVALGVMATVPVPGASSSEAPAPVFRAVVTLDGVRSVTAPGVRVLATFPHVGAELVAATRDGLSRLARQTGVIGIADDVPMTVAGKSYGPGASVLAPEVLGGQAGTAGAGRGVNVALLDTGVTDTPALNRASGRITDGVDVSQLGTGEVRTSGTFTDGYGHGTFLASLIAGGKVAGSGERAIGVAPAARIVVAKVADDQGNTSLGKVLAGFDWVAAHARGPAPQNQQMINVLNVALSVVKPGPTYGADPLTVAVEHVRATGVVVVAAAGNDASGVGDPGMDPQALTVGAAEVSGDVSVADFSGRGVVAGVTKPDLVAPGVHVLGVMPTSSQIWQQHEAGRQPDGLFRGSGTSEATAVTSGAAALFLSRHPDATPLQVKASLRKAARPLSAAGSGAGLLRVASDVVNPGSGGTGSGGTDWSGEAGFDASSWSASSWSGTGDWTSLLASSWSASSWSASSWSASSWSASSWSASSWSASSWSASSWSASSWSASSWSASSWSASSWSAASWGEDA